MNARREMEIAYLMKRETGNENGENCKTGVAEYRIVTSRKLLNKCHIYNMFSSIDFLSHICSKVMKLINKIAFLSEDMSPSIKSAYIQEHLPFKKIQ